MKELSKKEIITMQIRGIVIFNYLYLFNIMEKSIRDNFKENLDELEIEMKNRLYFMYGGKLNSYIDYNDDSIKLNNIKFKANETFDKLTINQIINLNKKFKFMKCFLITIPSVNRTTENFDMHDCIIKNIKMRNKLAHETQSFKLSDQEIIEIFQNKKLEELSYNFLSNFDLNLLDNDSKAILSNFYYMDKIINLIKDSSIYKQNLQHSTNFR